MSFVVDHQYPPVKNAEAEVNKSLQKCCSAWIAYKCTQDKIHMDVELLIVPVGLND